MRVVYEQGAASRTKRGAPELRDRPISCVSCSPIRWSSSRVKSEVGEVGELCYITGSGLGSASVEVTPGDITSPDLLSGLGAWVLVMCVGKGKKQMTEH